MEASVAQPLDEPGAFREAAATDLRAALTWRPLGELLLSSGLLEPGQLAAAFEEQRETGTRLGDVIVRRGWLTRTELMGALAQQARLPYVDLADIVVDPAVALLLPEHLAARYEALPLQRLADGSILVGVAEGRNVRTLDDLRLALGGNVCFALVDAVDLELAGRQVHRSTVELEELAESDDDTEEREDLVDVAATPAMKFVNAAIARAIDERASDIHFVPEEQRLVVRARIDGVVQELMSIPKSMQQAVLSRLKIMGSLDIAERRQPQDGRVLVRFAGKPIDLRIAVLPTTHGERIVLRVLQRATTELRLGELGMDAGDEAAFLSSLRQPAGVIIVCGPTGSGKTTTLYTGLGLLNDRSRVLITIEDPVEYQIEGISQIEVNVRSGLTFARGLRTILRSDPDVMLVGEIRDEETAQIAIQAAMTGHLVMTSLHADDAVSAIPRLRDMGIDPSLLASSVNCIIAQRLVRRLCVDCREGYAATPGELARLGLSDTTTPVMLWRPVGCARCRRTGFRGRVALYEVMRVNAALRTQLNASTDQIFAAARADGMRSLRDSGYRLCREGVSSVDEMHRVLGDAEE